MSPASAGANLEVERYIGACLISSQNRKTNVARNNHREFAPPPIDHLYNHPQRVNFRLQRCQSQTEGWAGGMPLISFTNHARRMNRDQTDEPHSPLARLAVHTQGAPLILTKSYNHRKNKVHRNNNNGNGGVATTKVFENSNIKKQNGVDAVSVTSDESSSSTNSETCLPRIIKPRKRRKKDRKPLLLGRPLSQDDFSTDSASPDVDTFLSYNSSLLPFYLSESPQLIDRLHILGDISETPKLQHSFEDVQEPDINGNQSTSTCQCRYCDPSGQIWDVDRNCYSPFLTPPNNNNTFQFPSIANTNAMSCLEHSLSSISLEEEDPNRKLPPSRSSSSSSCRDLEVSTEIVTSLNGHRDLEIKFFSSSSLADASGKSNSDVSRTTDRCAAAAVNSAKFVSEE